MFRIVLVLRYFFLYQQEGDYVRKQIFHKIFLSLKLWIWQWLFWHHNFILLVIISEYFKLLADLANTVQQNLLLLWNHFLGDVTDYFYFAISLCITCTYYIKNAHGKLVETFINTKSSTKFVFHNPCIVTIVYLHKQKQF